VVPISHIIQPFLANDTHTDMCMYVCIMYVCMCVCVCVYIYIYIYIHICVCIYIQTGLGWPRIGTGGGRF